MSEASLPDPDSPGRYLKQIFIHCGLHKTGSTALQMVMAGKAEILANHGLLYPKTARQELLGGGHHGIAWQVSRDRRFERNHGRVDQLTAEINAFDGSVIISSEDFESCLTSAQSVERLVRAFDPCNAELVLVIYLRSQISYCESAFIENLGQNIGEEFNIYLDQILRTGRMSVKDWSFQFDYRRVFDLLAAAGVKVIVRNFHTLEGASVVTDFLSALSIPAEAFADQIDRRSNMRLPKLQALRNFNRNRLNRALNEAENEAAQIVCNMTGKAEFVMSMANEDAFRAAFLTGNLELCNRFNLDTRGLDLAMDPSDPAQSILYERIFSCEFQYLIGEMRNLLRSRDIDQARRLARDFVQSCRPV